MGQDIPERIRIPDIKEYSYQEINKFPNLVKFQEELAREGLKDPWMRWGAVVGGVILHVNMAMGT